MDKFIKISTGLISAMAPLAAFAQQAPNVGAPTVITSWSGVIGVINTIVDWMFGILLALAVIFLIYAAYLYLTAAGNEENVKKAKDVIIYAIVAIIVAVLARGIVLLVQSLVGATPQTPV